MVYPLVSSRWPSFRRKPVRCRPGVERLEDRIMPSGGPIDPFTLPSPQDDYPALQSITLTANSASQDGAINSSGDTDSFKFTATASGRVTVKMTALTNDLQSSLTAPGTTLYRAVQVASATLTAGTLDDVIQFDVLAGHDYTIQAAGGSSSVGYYTLAISTVVDDVSADSYFTIPLNAGGNGTHTGKIDYAGDADLYAFVSSVTGQATIMIDGGVIPTQAITMLVNQGQTYAFSAYANGPATGSYNVTISSIADDFHTITPLTVNPDGSAVQDGTINYAADVDLFSYKAPVSGIMTLSMTTPFNSALASHVQVQGVIPLHEFTPSPGYNENVGLTRNDLIQVEVVAGQEYWVRAAGLSTSHGGYRLTFTMVTDDHPANDPATIAMATPALTTFSSPSDPTVYYPLFANPQGQVFTSFGFDHQLIIDAQQEGFQAGTFERGIQTGSIESPGDTDLYQFTAGSTGYALVQLIGMAGYDFHGMLTAAVVEGDGTTPVSPVTVDPADYTLVDPFTHSTSYLINTAGEIIFTSQFDRNTLDPIIAIQVEAGKTYQLTVSGDGSLLGTPAVQTIGKYTLLVETFSADTGPVSDDGNGNLLVIRKARDPDTFYTIGLVVTFTPGGQPQFGIAFSSAKPQFAPPPAGPPSDARLVVASLPGSNSSSPTPTPTGNPPTIPGLGGNTGGGGSTLPGSSLVASLLNVAALDNAVTGSANAEGGTVLVLANMPTRTTIQRDNTGTDGTDGSNSSVSGTVFDDLNGDGVKQADEPGLPGETVVLEQVVDGKTVAVATATTDSSGRYHFDKLKPGDYQVRLERMAGKPTTFIVRIVPQSQPSVVNLGMHITTGAWLDLEPVDLADAPMPSATDIPVLVDPLTDAAIETSSVENAESASIRCLLFAAFGATLVQERKRVS